MSGYPWIYWLVVLIVAGAGCSVLMGIGYLVGIKRAARRVATVREEMAQDRNRWAVLSVVPPPPPLPGPKKARIR